MTCLSEANSSFASLIRDFLSHHQEETDSRGNFYLTPLEPAVSVSLFLSLSRFHSESPMSKTVLIKLNVTPPRTPLFLVVCGGLWWLVVVSGESSWGPLPRPGLGLRRFHLNPK